MRTDMDLDDEDDPPEDEIMLLFLEIPIPPEEAARVLLEEYGEPWCRDLVAKLLETTLPLEHLFTVQNDADDADDADEWNGEGLPFTGVAD